MLNLNAVLDAGVVREVQEYTALRIKHGFPLRTAEALALYEQRYLSQNKIRELSEVVYGITLYEPMSNYVPEDIAAEFRESKAVPVAYLPMGNIIQAVYLPEFEPDRIEHAGMAVEMYPTTLNYYLERYQVLYGRHEMLQDIPGSLLFNSVVNEAIALGAADITISTLGKSSRVYYNVRKKLVESNRIMPAESIAEIITYLTIKSPYNWGTREPKYVDVDLTKDFRGRVVINTKHKGYVLTIRLLPNKAFDMDIGGIGLTDMTCKWLVEHFIMDREAGLRLIVGETMSGKNTTALALLRKLVATGGYKVVSVEMPVEQELPGVEQINTETVLEYGANIKSLIHQNPDFVYITEIRDSTGLDTVQITNTGKRVLSTLHANGVADVLPRLADITGLSLDRIVQSLHSVVFQKLIRDDKKDIVYPRDRYVRFTERLKHQLYGKTLGDMLKIVKEEESGDGF